ncbi:MAG TPA: hypothetical protein VGR57_08800 [Ktedonobacterales bacterium]|nr:hypothetical protein [Ktedonobacterales bacterium]
MARDSRFHPIKGLKRLVQILPGDLGRSAQSALDRFAEGVDRLHTAFQPQPGEDLNSPAYAQRITTEIIYQLSRLDAEAKLQCKELSPGKQGPHPGQLEIAVYGLSGIREQLDAIADRYESALAQAKAQRTALLAGGSTVGTRPLRPDEIEAHTHPQTLVDYSESPRARGPLAGIFARPQPKGNEGLAKRLVAIFTEISKNTDELERAFHTAQARSLEQLGVPMDELRGSAKWLHDREVSFYS